MSKLNWTTIALIGGLVLLVLLVAYFATRGNADQDKLTNVNVASNTVPSGEKACASKATYDLIKRELFRRAAQLRGSDQAAYDRLSNVAVVRMENPVMESEDRTTSAVHCSGSLSLDLPPGVAVVGGRRTLTADVDYTVQPAADGTGPVVLLSNADAIIAPLATLARVAAPAPTAAPDQNEIAPSLQPPAIPAPAPGAVGQPAQPVPAPPPSAAAPAPRTANARPSFNCANARTRGEVAVCGDAGLAALDRQMSSQFIRALSQADPVQRAALQRTRNRFLAYRDRCGSAACMADAYRGRMQEISDIMDR